MDLRSNGPTFGHNFSQVLNQSAVTSFEKNLNLYTVCLRER